eukprot:TCALIF_13409-PA protein Name:"Similar to T Transposable element P transposase (Drosophila melanogaster)" AED:0.43 eAED:0.45 QI:0/0/0/1/1/1/2/0/323
MVGLFVRLGKEDFEDIMSKDSGEFKIAFKLTKEHVECKGSARQRVRLACQIFSRTTAKCFTFLYGEDDQTASIKENTILLFNNWFDVMNSRVPVDFKNPLKSAFGQNIHAQMKNLEDMAEFIDGMRLDGGRPITKLPWQFGILASINSMKAMYKYLTTNTNVRYILTLRLNQDFLENFFSQLRRMSGDNAHPGPVEALRRLRILLLGKNYNFLIKNPSVQFENSEETYVSSEIFKEYLEPHGRVELSRISYSLDTSSAFMKKTLTGVRAIETTRTAKGATTSGATETTRVASSTSTTGATTEKDVVMHTLNEDEDRLFQWIES